MRRRTTEPFKNGAFARSGDGADSVDALDDLARAALAEGEEEAALSALIPAAERLGHPTLWQWVGLLQRALDDHAAAIASFEVAARLAPRDAGIAHGQARVALEAGLDAVGLFERARALAPQDGAVLLGLIAARAAVGQGERAAGELEAALELAPGWAAGHGQLAQLLSTLGRRSEATASLERALARMPRESNLWSALFDVHLRRESYESLQADVERARSAGIPAATLAVYDAICAAELDDSTHPPALFDGAPAEADRVLGIWRVRHLLRCGAIDAALPIIDAELRSERASMIWPYASLAWRLSGDVREQWLEGDARLVRIADLGKDLPPLDKLAARLRSLHVARGEYLDQSVRGGTQTDGPLLSRIDPLIRALRAVVVGGVDNYVAELPPQDAAHPLLRERRDRRVRFSGSWSVRLRSGGRHSSHVHPQGWISSALYIDLPPKLPSDPADAGWLTIGQPDERLQTHLAPIRKIEPKAAHLVLFPSWMWHGTLPFSEGERLTVAFDVRPPV